MIEVRAISKSFGSRTVWSDLSFSLEEGHLVALTGPSGSGKSTLLNCIGLLEKIDKGEIFHDGKNVTKFGARESRLFRRDTLGYLFQNYALIENATVKQNLDLAVSSRRRKMSYDAALSRVGLAGAESEVVHHLSGGEQQRLALARLLVKGPAIVLADESTGALDKGNASIVIDILREMTGRGCIVVVATHNEHVERECDLVLRLDSARSSTERLPSSSRGA